jgi:hypothetical protein
MTHRSASLVQLVLLAACLLPTTTTQAGPGSWSIHNVGCDASQQHALHRDDDATLWVGCGTGSSGFGLHRSTDGGQSWQVPTTNPAGIIDTFRVHDIERGHDGALYLAGTISDTGTQYRIVRLDTSGTQPYPAEATLIGAPVAGLNDTIGHYAELDSGAALTASQTGWTKLFRPDPTVGSSAQDWTRLDGIEPFTSLIAHDGGFYASGSRNSVAPRIFLPSQAPGAQPFELDEVILDPGYDGELWGIAVNDQRVVAVGRQTTPTVGKIYVSSGDPYNPANYSVHEFRDDGASWAHGVCMRGDRIVVVGRRFPSGSRALASTNGGVSFFDISPTGFGALLSQCVIAPDGELTVFGSGGFIGVFDGLVAGDVLFADRFQ